ncbi:MAG: hypothetical protein WBB50_05645 [Methyloceanibacter sp.]
MLRAALALLSTLQIGARVKESIERSLRQAAIIAVAATLMLAAAVFGLIAAYHGLVSIYGFSPVEAASIMAACLLVVGIIVLASASLIGREPKREKPPSLLASGEDGGLVDQGVGKVMQQVGGPLPLLAIAFLAGLFAGRR